MIILGIYILEDQLFQAEMLKKVIERIMKEHGYARENVHIFSRGIDLLNRLYQPVDVNIYFLDIQIKNDIQAGLKTAKELRKLDKDGLIVFITSHSELAITSYKYMVSALTFIEKNTDVGEFYSAVENCLDVYGKKQESNVSGDIFYFKSKSLEIKILFNDLYYFRTTYDHRIELVAKTQVREFFGELNKLEDSESKLTRIHQSYLVNFANVVELDKKHKELILFNGDRLPISRKYYKKIVEIFKTLPNKE